MMLPIIYMNLLLCMFKSVTFTILYFAFYSPLLSQQMARCRCRSHV